MGLLLGTVFVASLIGSLHCVGMCGPFAMLSSAGSEQRRSVVVPAISYSSGRLLVYSLVGFLFGSFGMALNQGGSALAGDSLSSFQQTATYAAGGLMIGVGAIALARQFGWRIQLPSAAGWIQSILQRSYRWVTMQPPLRKAFMIGSLSCLMPCGWLYTFALVAAGTASPLLGTVVMIVFWAGTVPIMTALMLGAGKMGQSLQKRLPFAMASLVIFIGVFTIAFRAPIAIGSESPVTPQEGNLVEQVQQLDHEKLPCCQNK